MIINTMWYIWWVLWLSHDNHHHHHHHHHHHQVDQPLRAVIVFLAGFETEGGAPDLGAEFIMRESRFKYLNRYDLHKNDVIKRKKIMRNVQGRHCGCHGGISFRNTWFPQWWDQVHAWWVEQHPYCHNIIINHHHHYHQVCVLWLDFGLINFKYLACNGWMWI